MQRPNFASSVPLISAHPTNACSPNTTTGTCTKSSLRKIQTFQIYKSESQSGVSFPSNPSTFANPPKSKLMPCISVSLYFIIAFAFFAGTVYAMFMKSFIGFYNVSEKMDCRCINLVNVLVLFVMVVYAKKSSLHPWIYNGLWNKCAVRHFSQTWNHL